MKRLRRYLAFFLDPQLRDELNALRSANTKLVLKERDELKYLHEDSTP